MNRDLLRRVERLEHGGGPPDDNSPVLVRISGGLPGMSYRAQIGARCLLPLPGEAEADFLDRALDCAADLGEAIVVVSGMMAANQ
jgi:hypothetical protein